MTPEQLLLATPRRVTSFAWNNDGTNLAVGLTNGFIIYNTENVVDDDGWLHEVCRRPVNGGVSVIALYAQTNLLVTAGWASGHRSTVMIHNLLVTNACENEERAVIAQVTLPSAVNGICFHPYLIAVGIESGRVYLFDRALQQIESYEVAKRVKSPAESNVMAMASLLDKQEVSKCNYFILRLVILGKDIGSVRCVRYTCEQMLERSLEDALGEASKFIAEPLRVKTVELHRNAVRSVTITPDGSYALTVSERGTALKLLDVEKGVVLFQFSRGTTPNLVHAVALFVTVTDIIATCITDTGTLHLFHVSPTMAAERATSHNSEEEKQSVADLSIVRMWTDHCKSIAPKARLTIPEDTVCNGRYGHGGFIRSTYALALRPQGKKDSCLAYLVQRDSSTNGVPKSRLLCVQIDLTAQTKPNMNVVRSFYFPKDEI